MTIPQHTETNSSEAEDQLPALQQDSDMVEHDRTMWAGDDDADANHVYTPPPHLAKRLARPGTNRRRSSAASSRRNSITSSQSHHSNRSCHAPSQRNYIDQHLRRASVIEDRKARLATRAAHVEQVRLRAALAKAAPRGSNTEEKALAAQQAREKLLAKVAAACAEEVNRAKRVAEETKERKAAEEKRYRQELEEKHAEAERRRLEYKRTSRRARTTSTANADQRPVVLKKKLTEIEAVATIKRAWRRSRRQKAVNAFLKLNLSIDRVREASFEDATKLLANADTITHTRNLLRQMRLDVGAEKETTQVRTFLSAFMMLGHAATVCTKTGQQEQDLISKARDLLISFESTLSEYSATVSAQASETSLQTLAQSHATYVTSFTAWKAEDASVIIESMVDQFVTLDAVWQTVKDDPQETINEYRDGIRNQQIIILSKLKRLAGDEAALLLVKKAIRASRRQQTQRRPRGDVRPRPIAEANAPPDANTATVISQEVDNSRSHDFELTEVSRVFSVIPPNRVLVHELMIDPSYRIEVSPQSDVRNALNREVCESMRRGVAAGQSEMWTVAVAQNIQQRLLKLLKPGNSMHTLLSEVLDVEHIRVQCRQGQFSYEKFFSFLADLLPRLCAPVRDPEVNALAQVLKSPADGTDAMIEKLFGLLHVIDLLSLDYTNYLVSEKAPLLIREGQGYEQRAFRADLDAGRTTLDQTTRWWRNASVNVVTEASNLDSSRGNARPAFAQIYARGLVDLAVGLEDLREADVPETLALDLSRLSRIRSDMLRFTIVGGILLTAKNLLRRDVRTQWKTEARRIFDSMREMYNDPSDDISSRILAIIESSHGMPASSRGHLAGTISRFLSEAHAQRLTDPMLKLLLQRLKSHLFNRVAAQSSIERVRVTTTSSEGLAAIGLGEFIGQVSTTVEELRKVSVVDQQTHGEWLRKIAQESEGLEGAQTVRT